MGIDTYGKLTVTRLPSHLGPFVKAMLPNMDINRIHVTGRYMDYRGQERDKNKRKAGDYRVPRILV